MFKKTYIYLIISFAACHLACTEPFEIEQDLFKSAIVIEATITDEEKYQTIKVSRSFPLDTMLVAGERNANVKVTDDTGQVFPFADMGSGTYQSETPFSAVQGRTYSLAVETTDGSTYNSTPSEITASTPIDNIFVSREFNNDTQEGVFIYLDGGISDENATNFRYTYEETYKIIAPFYSSLEAFVVAPLPDPRVGTRLRQENQRICYATQTSTNIIQTSSEDINNNKVKRFPIRFISKENYIISHRYSILVTQIVQSPEAFAYYETLNTLSSSESLFTQIQPGFLEGNILSSTNSNEKVIGFFEVASVSKQRLFFNYEDLFPGEPLPDYTIDCTFISPVLLIPAPGGGTSPLVDGIELGLYDFFEDYDGVTNFLNLRDFGPFLMTPAGCGDCTQFGSTLIPDFWVN